MELKKPATITAGVVIVSCLFNEFCFVYICQN